MKKNKKLFWILFLLFISIVLFLISCYHLESDYFWHIKAGDFMFHHSFLREDVFSWIVRGKYWMSHEWLFEIILYGLRLLFGNYHIFFYLGICLLGLFSVLFFTCFKNYSKNILYSFVFIFFLVVLLAFYIQARPHMMSLIFLSITIWFLFDLYHHKESKKIYFLPLISILWANIHGGSSNLVYLFCFLFWIGGLFSFQYKKIEAKKMSKIQLNKYFWVMILCMIGVCINIHGFKMFFYPYQNMLDTTMIHNISEWQSSSLNIPFHLIYYVFLIFILFTYLLSEKKIQWIDFILTGFVSYLGLKSIRFWGFAPITMSFFIFDYVKERRIEKGTYLGITVISVLLIGISIMNYQESSIFSKDKSIYIQKDLLSIIELENPKRLYNMYNYGAELIYHDVSVFIDGRADLYSSYNYNDYLDICYLKNGYEELLNKYQFDYYLVDDSYPIYSYLRMGDYYEIYSRESVHFFKKSS